MRVCVWTGVCLVCFFGSSLQQDDGFGDDYLVAELPGQMEQKAFRPVSARQAMRQAAREAQKQRSQESGEYALMQDTAIGVRGIRVAVYDVVDVTTSRYNSPRFRRFSRISEGGRRRGVGRYDYNNPYNAHSFITNDIQVVEASKDAPKTVRSVGVTEVGGNKPPPRPPKPRPPAFFDPMPSPEKLSRQLEFERQQKFKSFRKPKQKRDEKSHQRSFRNIKRKRSKREVDDYDPEVASQFELPPMSNEWDIKKKKKKKKKKTTEAPITKKVQKKSARRRIFLHSEELALKTGKGSPPDVVKGLSEELNNLFKDIDDQPERYTSSPVAKPTKTKFVPVPKNWQCPPSWKPPTRGPAVQVVPRGRRRYAGDIVTIGPQVISDESEEVTTQGSGMESSTSFDWKNYDNPLKDPKKEGLVLKPAPEDWPEPTHPADGIYDWHKTQYRRAPRTRRPFVMQTMFPRSSENQNYFSRIPRRHSSNFIPYTYQTTPWSWDKPAKEETAMFHRNDMWQTRAWIPNIPPASTWPPIGTKRPIEGLPDGEVDGFNPELRRNHGPPSDQTHLTTGLPLAAVSDAVLDLAMPKKNEAPNPQGHQEHQQYSYNYSPQHAAWQSNVQGQQRGPQGQTNYQSYHNYYTNYTNYYNQYYQQYYQQLANKTSAYHYEQRHHYQDKYSASGHFQSYYHQQNQAQKQSRLKPPAYFYNVMDELGTTVEPVEEKNGFAFNRQMPTGKTSYRLPNEYAGNDRDLRAPLASSLPGYSPPSRTAWAPAPARLRPNEYAGNDRDLRAPLASSLPGYSPPSRTAWAPAPARLRPAAPWRRHQGRMRRPLGLRPTGYRSIFNAPLQRATLPHRHSAVLPGGVLVTPRVL